MSDTGKFLSAASFAVAGVSRNQAKYGNLIFRKLLESGRVTYPLNPAADTIEGRAAYPDLKSLPETPEAISVVTTPAVTERIISDAIALGVKHIWMQPGAEHATASRRAREAGINVIDDGSCILVALALE